MNIFRIAASTGLSLFLFSVNAPAQTNPSSAPMAATVRELARVPGGLIVFPAGADQHLVRDCVATPGPRLFVQAGTQAATLRAALGELGVTGVRVWVENGGPERIPLATDTADLVALPLDQAPMALTEAARVVAPGGRLALWAAEGRDGDLVKRCTVAGFGTPLLKSGGGVRWAVAEKSFPAGTDEWPLWYHGPDNNQVSKDGMFVPPDVLQFLCWPIHASIPTVTTASGGRMFTATGRVARGVRGFETLFQLTARSTFNGEVLWRRPMEVGNITHRSLYYATPDIFHLAEKDAVLRLDARTGAELSKWVVASDGEVKWFCGDEKRLYVLSGPPDPPSQASLAIACPQDASWFNRSQGTWPHGFGHQVIALDPSKGTELWRWKNDGKIDSRSLAISGGRLFAHVREVGVFAVDITNGKQLWANTDAQMVSRLAEIRPGEKVASSPSVIATPEQMFLGPSACPWLFGISASDGRLLWTLPRYKETGKDNAYHKHSIFLDGKLVSPLAELSDIDPATGAATKSKLTTYGGACVRPNASQDWIFGRGRRANFRTGFSISDPTRADCYSSVLLAHGRGYWFPHFCDCNYPLGIMGRTPRDFDKTYEIESRANRLETAANTKPDPFPVDAADWPAARGGNERKGSSSVACPGKPSLQWMATPRSSSMATPAIAANNYVFTAGFDGAVRAWNLADGSPRWTAWTGGAIRTAPTLWDGRVLVGSVDGWITCLAATDGRQLWKYRAAPMERRIMFYDTLASTWPVSGGVIVHDGVAYCAAGLFGADGVTIHALDPQTGAQRWVRETGKLPGVLNRTLEISAVGGWTVQGKRLRMASGAKLSPATFDPATGEFLPLSGQKDQLIDTDMAKGAQIGVFRNRHIIYGGKPLIAENWNAPYRGRYQVATMDADGKRQAADIFLAGFSTAMPAWDDSVLVHAGQDPAAYNGAGLIIARQVLECFQADALDKFLSGRVTAEKDLKSETQGSHMRTANPALRGEGMLRWTVKRAAVAVAVSADAVIVAEERYGEHEVAKAWALVVLDKATGAARGEVALPSCPTTDGLCIARDGTVVVSLLDGRVAAIRGK